MSVIKIRLGDNIASMGPEFEKAVEDMFRSVKPVFYGSAPKWRPAMDIYESADEIIVLAELAGVDKDNLEVEVNSKAVRIVGFRPAPRTTENATYRLAEIQYGDFERTIFFPSPIDTQSVKASYADGFLRIQLTKKPKDVPHKIHISDG